MGGFVNNLLLAAIGIALAATLASAAAIRPASAEAQAKTAPADFFGVNAVDFRHFVAPQHEGILRGHAESMSEQGIDWARISFAQYIDNPARGQFNWYSADRMVAALAREGVRPEGLFVGTAAWAARPDEWAECSSRARPHDLGGWGDWAAAAVERFGPGGSFWNENPELPELPITRWEVGNEPNTKRFWCPKPDPEQYAAVYSATVDAIEAVDPDAEVMVGGLAPLFGWGNGVDVYAHDFLTGITAADPGLTERIDSVAIHPYGTSTSESLYWIARFRRAMTEAGLSEVPMVVNEVGWYASGPDGPFKVTEQERAKRIGALADQLWRTDCGIDGLAPYSWITPQQAPELDSDWWGMTEVQTGNPLPSGLAYGEQIRIARGEGPAPAPQSTVAVCDGPELTIDRVGEGTVYSSLGGAIECGQDCSEALPEGAEVTLTAFPAGLHAFRGWTGCDSVSGNKCTVTVGADRTVRATFVRQWELVVDKTGPGTVTTSPAGIDCGTGCRNLFDTGTGITVTAQPAAGYGVRFWGGCDSVSGNQCTITLGQHRTVFVSFFPQHPLTVDLSGIGTVVNNVLGLACGQSCSTPVQAGSYLILYAVPAPGYVIGAWIGCDHVQGNQCHVTVEAASSVSVTFVPERNLTVQRTGAGTVTSSPAAIDCGGTCEAVVGEGSWMVLKAVPAAGYAFKGWTGCTYESGASCGVTIAGDKTVEARFALQRWLTVERTSPGGKVTASAAGIDCGAVCTGQADDGSKVTLAAAPDPGYGVRFWSGCESVSGNTCVVDMSNHRTVFVGFIREHQLTVQRTGAGRVVNQPYGIDCGVGCSARIPDGVQAILYAVPDEGEHFRGWSGCSSVDGNRCYSAMSAARSVSATFSQPRKLTVHKQGAGTVTSSPAGISCGASCVATLPEGTAVTLTATPVPGYELRGWSGCATAAGNTCTISMSAEQTVTAQFAALPVPPQPVTAPAAASAAPPSPPETWVAKTRLRGTGEISFRLRGSGHDLSYLCKLDRGRFRPCGTSKSYRVRPGRHTFRAAAVDPAGRRDPTPAKRKFRVR